MSVLLDLGTYLDGETIATQDLTLGTNLFLGREPADPDTCVTLYETGGRAAEDFFGDGTVPAMERPSVQMRVRASGYSTASALAGDVWQALTKVSNDTLSGTLYQRVMPLQSPFAFDRDDRDRMVFVANFTVLRNV